MIDSVDKSGLHSFTSRFLETGTKGIRDQGNKKGNKGIREQGNKKIGSKGARGPASNFLAPIRASSSQLPARTRERGRGEGVGGVVKW